jgi:hypothetical protein
MRLGQFFWMGLVVLLLALALAKTIKQWQSALPDPKF